MKNKYTHMEESTANNFIVLNDHNFNELIGKIVFIKRFDPTRVDWDKYCFGAGYIPKETDKDGNVTKVELLEISLVKCPETKNLSKIERKK